MLLKELSLPQSYASMHLQMPGKPGSFAFRIIDNIVNILMAANIYQHFDRF
jgi:hypothetical protein